MSFILVKNMVNVNMICFQWNEYLPRTRNIILRHIYENELKITRKARLSIYWLIMEINHCKAAYIPNFLLLFNLTSFFFVLLFFVYFFLIFSFFQHTSCTCFILYIHVLYNIEAHIITYSFKQFLVYFSLDFSCIFLFLWNNNVRIVEMNTFQCVEFNSTVNAVSIITNNRNFMILF